MAEPEAKFAGIRTKPSPSGGWRRGRRSGTLVLAAGGLREGREVYRYFARYKEALAIVSTGNAVCTPAPMFSLSPTIELDS